MPDPAPAVHAFTAAFAVTTSANSRRFYLLGQGAPACNKSFELIHVQPRPPSLVGGFCCLFLVCAFGFGLSAQNVLSRHARLRRHRFEVGRGSQRESEGVKGSAQGSMPQSTTRLKSEKDAPWNAFGTSIFRATGFAQKWHQSVYHRKLLNFAQDSGDGAVPLRGKTNLEVSVAQEHSGAACLSRDGCSTELHALFASFAARVRFSFPCPLLFEVRCSLVRRPPAQAVFALGHGRSREGAEVRCFQAAEKRGRQSVHNVVGVES